MIAVHAQYLLLYASGNDAVDSPGMTHVRLGEEVDKRKRRVESFHETYFIIMFSLREEYTNHV